MKRLLISFVALVAAASCSHAAFFELIESGRRPHDDPIFLDAIFSGLGNLSGDGFHAATINYCCPVCDCGLVNMTLDLQTSELKSTDLDRLSDFSFDGETVVGTVYRNSAYHAVRATVGSDLEYINAGSPTSKRDSYAYAISNDNSTIVGQDNDRPVAWTSEGRTRLSNALGRAVGVSADGTAVIIANPGAIRWTKENGAEDLGIVDDYLRASPVDISADGSVVTGLMHRVLGPNQGFEQHAFRWTADAGMVKIGEFLPQQMSDDGQVVIGESTIWFADRGEVSFNELVFEQTGVRIDEPLGVGGVSADGRSFVGAIGGADYGTTGVVLRLGEFSDCDLNGDSSCDAIDIDAMAFGEQTQIFRTAFDLDQSNQIGFEDRRMWIEERMNSYFGDANLDGEFNSSDLTLVFQASRYEEQLAHPNDRYLTPVSWSEGDWNGDLQFNSKDLIAAFRTSAYEQGQRPLQAVPEPGFAGLAVAFVIWFSCRGNRQLSTMNARF